MVKYRDVHKERLFYIFAYYGLLDLEVIVLGISKVEFSLGGGL